MTLRDRLVLTAVVALAIIGAAWVLVVSPQRKQANELSTQLTSAKAQLSSAETQLASARSAQSRYAAAYASLVSLGKAVPTSQEVPALLYQLAQASKERDVDFASITTTTGPAASGASSASGSAAAAVASAGFSTLPFTFVFNGSYFGLEHMLRTLADLTTRGHSGALQVSGRLLTIQTVKLSGQNEAKGSAANALSATVTASAYELPPEASTAALPGASASASASTSGAPSPTAPAIVRLKP